MYFIKIHSILNKFSHCFFKIYIRKVVNALFFFTSNDILFKNLVVLLDSNHFNSLKGNVLFCLIIINTNVFTTATVPRLISIFWLRYCFTLTCIISVTLARQQIKRLLISLAFPHSWWCYRVTRF